ncbi:MAG: C39 family peptidase, partial [Candidatus Thorarchaeota archaeon]|nr:C39 family peptidase [Candidatus Thorarchaeota archaeon]
MAKSINSKFQLKRAVSITVVLLSLSISLTTTTQVIVLADVINLPTLTAFDTANEIPSFFALDIPYYEQETGQSGGVAALKMALGHYGWTIDESELIRVARTSYLWWNTGTNGWDLLRAAHFSNSSTSFHDPTLQGYTNKWSGVDSAAGVITEAYSSENRTQVLDLIKGLLLDDKVTIFTMWYAGDQDFVRQFRVLVGYDDRTDELIFADPWDDPYWSTSY